MFWWGFFFFFHNHCIVMGSVFFATEKSLGGMPLNPLANFDGAVEIGILVRSYFRTDQEGLTKKGAATDVSR